MRHITANSVNQALHEGLYHLKYLGIDEPSRNGNVVVSPTPVLTTYLNPRNRVLVSATRDANPFFHLFESLWMLAGRNDVAFPAKFASRIATYSDDGETLHGAYGHRWRKWFGYDQLDLIIGELKSNPSSRRCVLQMWDGFDTGGSDSDLHTAIDGGKDVPCNTAAYFDTIGGKLNMTVTCRSNDIIWGAYGANAVHFSMLLEYVAAMTDLSMGVYRQFSNNFHAYESVVTRDQMPGYADAVAATCIYSSPTVLKVREYGTVNIGQVPMFSGGDEGAWHEDLGLFMDLVDNGQPGDGCAFRTAFFSEVVGPMFTVWRLWKDKEFDTARHATLSIVAEDWRIAAQSWLSIREQNRKEK